jgi:uncharacterized membrane protein (DUF106 family)
VSVPLSIVDRVLGAVFDALLYPFRGLPPLVGLLVVSLLAALGMLIVFKKTSNQPEIVAVKRRILACMFEMRLFSDDLRAILRAQLEVLRHDLTYMRLSLTPLLWLIVPFVLVLAQLQAHYGYQGLEPGDRAIVTVALDNGWERTLAAGATARPPLTLAVPDGLKVETPGLWIPSLDEIDWRIAAERAGTYQVTVVAGDRRMSKRIDVSDGAARRSPARAKPGLESLLLFPGERPLPGDAPVRAIRVDYRAARIPIFGLAVHWLVVFFVLSIAFALALRKRLGVAI